MPISHSLYEDDIGRTLAFKVALTVEGSSYKEYTG